LHNPGQLGNANYKHFQPRIGAAYKLGNKMVVRAGFAVTTMDLFLAGTATSSYLNQNFQEYVSNVTVQSLPGNPNPAFFLSQGPGALNYNILPNGTSPFVGTNYSSRTAERYDPNLRNPYMMNWNVTYQYEFRPDWMLELTYQGSSGVGLLE